MPAVIGPEDVAAAGGLQPERPVEERVVRTAQGDADQGTVALLGNPVAGGAAVRADQTTWPVLQFAVVAQFGQAGARHDHRLSAAAWAHDVDEVRIRGQGPASVQEPALGNPV